MKIIVTGGSGLLGSALKNIVTCAADTANTWVFLSSKECNLLDHGRVDELFGKEKPDYVIHLAAEVGGLFKNMTQRVAMLENNVLMNINVLQCAHAHNVQHVMCCLSTCVFPDKVGYPLKEHTLHQGEPHDSNYAYAYAKRLLDIQCQTYREQYSRDYFCVIPTNMYGPCDNFNLEDGHVIPSLIHRCYLAKRNKTPFCIRGSGTPLRQFLYSSDAARCILHLVAGGFTDGNVILSVPEKDEISIGTVAALISKYMQYENVHFLPEFSDGQYKKTADTARLESLLPPTFRFTPIEHGIKQTVEWFNTHAERARK
jgi:GDP-L-fucose synthase